MDSDVTIGRLILGGCELADWVDSNDSDRAAGMGAPSFNQPVWLATVTDSKRNIALSEGISLGIPERVETPLSERFPGRWKCGEKGTRAQMR